MTSESQLTDGNLLLRPPRSEDIDAIIAGVQESLAELQPWMDWATKDYGESAAQNWLEHVQLAWSHRSAFHFVITDANTGEYLGNCGIDGINEKYHFCNLGYWVRTSHTGKGIASRAARMVAQFAFSSAGLIRAEIVIAAGNIPSQHAAQKAGAHYEGILKNRMVIRSEIFDAVMYSLSPEDFKD